MYSPTSTSFITPPDSESFRLKDFNYSTTYPPTVRYAALLNSIQTFSPELVYLKLSKMRKSQKDTTSKVYNTLRKDLSWVKRMFMGDNGIDATVTVKPSKKSTTKPKPKPKPKTTKTGTTKPKPKPKPSTSIKPKPKLSVKPKPKPKLSVKPKPKPKPKTKAKAKRRV